jgi:hypothetical protein
MSCLIGEGCRWSASTRASSFIAAESRFLGRRAGTGFFREHPPPGLYPALSYLQANHMPGDRRYSKLASLSYYEALKSLHKMLSKKLAPNSEANKEKMQPNGF